MSREISLIVIHCSATPAGGSLFEGETGKAGFRTPAQVIDGWHQTRGFARNPNWVRIFNPILRSIGYHFVIYTNGAVATGRHVDEVGAHAEGHNKESIGICMVGMDRFTSVQWAALTKLTEQLDLKYPGAQICGHRDLSVDLNGDGVISKNEWLKTCPTFDVAEWLQAGRCVMRGHTFIENSKEKAA